MRNLNSYIPKAEEILQSCNIPYGKVESVEPNSRFRARWGDCTIFYRMIFLRDR